MKGFSQHVLFDISRQKITAFKHRGFCCLFVVVVVLGGVCLFVVLLVVQNQYGKGLQNLKTAAALRSPLTKYTPTPPQKKKYIYIYILNMCVCVSVSVSVCVKTIYYLHQSN